VTSPPWAHVYTYPVMAQRDTPGERRKLGRGRLLLTAGVILVVVVVVITLVGALVRPMTNNCGLYCGPHAGPMLISSQVYQNQKWGYSVEYDSSALGVANQTDDGAEFDAGNGDGAVVFTATQGADLASANRAALDGLDGATFQNIREIGPVRGAEIGLVNGQGIAYSADFVPTDGSGASPIGLVILSATHNGMTLTATAFSGQSMDNADLPYGLDAGDLFDFPITNTLWKGQ
jgi:hypothetical protein